MTKQLNLSKYKSPKTVATKLYEWCCQEAKKMGQTPEMEVFLWSPSESKERGYGNGWHVCWEAGPYEWAVRMSLGGSIYEEGYAYKKPPEVVFGGEVYGEPYYSFNLTFYKS